MTGLSIIILTRDRLSKVQACLSALLPQLTSGDEVLLVDTGSSDGTRERFAQSPPPCVRLAAYDGEGSWAEMRNFGVRQARGAMIAFLDDDCIPAPDWVARGRAGLTGADAVGGMARPLGIEEFPRWWHPDMGWMAGLSVPGHAGPDAGRFYYPFTANLWVRAPVCRAEPFQEVGGRLGGEERERYRTGREDAQWWRRLRTAGYRTRFDPRLCVGHGFDPARLNPVYLARRAELDGVAWAWREGTLDDLEPLAYQWWLQLGQMLGAPFADAGGRMAQWRLHCLTLRRHGAALKALAAKLNGERRTPAWLRVASALTRGLRQQALDRGKTLVRRMMMPWLRSRPMLAARRPPKRLTVLALGYLGDLVILQSALRGLIETYPKLKVRVLAPPSGTVALRGLDRVEVTPLPGNLAPGSEEAANWLKAWLRAGKPSAIVAPYLHGPWGRAVAAIRRPPRPITGFDNDQGLERMRYLECLALRVHKDLRFHEVQNLTALLKVAGLPCEPLPSRIHPTREARLIIENHPWLAAAEAAPDCPRLMINPDAGQPHKEWDNASWETLIRRILDETGWRVIVNLSRPRPELERVFGSTGGRLLWLRQAPLEELLAMMEHCHALLTVDAGPQHLAHALEVPSLTLYGPMDERRWADHWQRPIHKTLRACAFDLTPDELRGLPLNHIVAQIRPDDVYRELCALMTAILDHAS